MPAETPAPRCPHDADERTCRRCATEPLFPRPTPDRAGWLVHAVSAAGRPTVSHAQYEELRAETVALLAERDELSALFERQHAADMRAVAEWQAANPGKDLVLPDRARLAVWALGERDRAVQEAARSHAARHEAQAALAGAHARAELASATAARRLDLLRDWQKFAYDVQPGDAAGADWLDGLRRQTDAELSASGTAADPRDARIAALEEALRPFAKAFGQRAERGSADRRAWHAKMPGGWPIELLVTMSAGRTARALLAATPGDGRCALTGLVTCAAGKDGARAAADPACLEGYCRRHCEVFCRFVPLDPPDHTHRPCGGNGCDGCKGTGSEP